jgi:hypothetical protein
LGVDGCDHGDGRSDGTSSSKFFTQVVSLITGVMEPQDKGTTSTSVEISLSSAPSAEVPGSIANDNVSGSGSSQVGPYMDRKRRRSSRDTNRIQLSSSRIGALQFDRMKELFFQEEEDCDKRPHGNRSSIPNKPDILRYGKVSLERIYQAPNIYVIHDFFDTQ